MRVRNLPNNPTSVAMVGPLELSKFISISLDVVGSTKAKEDLRVFAEKHELNLSDLYSEYAKGLLHTESLFLRSLFAGKGNEWFDPTRLFLIKMIGDEWWYSYSLANLDEYEIGQHARHLVVALLAALSKEPISISVPSSMEAHPDGLDEFEDLFALEFPFKITCDLVVALDVGKERGAEISPIIANFCKKAPVRVGDGEFQRLMGNLGAISIISNQSTNKAVMISRSDFVGLEVDRFFRIAKEALKGRILVGHRLYEVLEVAEHPIDNHSLANGWKQASVHDKHRNGGFTSLHTDVFIRSFICDLKGISAPYEVTVFTDRFAVSSGRDWELSKPQNS